MRTRTHYKCHIYEDKGGEWRWKLVARNGRIVMSPHEGYKTEAGAVRSWEQLIYSLCTTIYVEVVHDTPRKP